MKLSLLALALLAASASTSFFKYERPIAAAASAGQHYVVVDDPLWRHALPGLSDIRLYLGQQEIPYKLETERGGAEIEQRQIRVLQPASREGKTQFLLDMAGIAEYDRIALNLQTRNFVAHARVSGQDDEHGAEWALLGTTTLYDLSDEKLGHNSTLQIPLSTYKFLEVTVDNSVKPADVLGGTAGITRPLQAAWRAVGADAGVSQQGKDSVATFTVGENVPVERIVFAVEAGQPNFRRDVEIQGAQGNWIGSGEISRIHMLRGGQRIDVEQTSIDTIGGRGGPWTVTIRNGDDLPLAIAGVRLEQYERRIYFDAQGASPTLYYGDAELRAPVYDYAKLFQKDGNASEVGLGSELANSAYAGRPDKRPWSERHPALLWASILAAVLVLGGVALKSARAADAS